MFDEVANSGTATVARYEKRYSRWMLFQIVSEVCFVVYRRCVSRFGATSTLCGYDKQDSDTKVKPVIQCLCTF